MIDEQRINEFRKLSSSSLEKLSLLCYDFDRIELDTPSLHSFALLNEWLVGETRALVSFRFPLAVRHLQCLRFDSNLSGLQNLETLICQEITFDFDLDNFGSLTRLELFPKSEHQLQVAKDIFAKRKRLQRDDLVILVSGFKEELMTIFFSHWRSYQLDSSYIDHLMRHRTNLVGHIPWELELNAMHLLEYADLIPENFFDKFSRITITTLSKSKAKITEDQQSFLIELIKRSEPSALQVSDTDLTKEFFKQILSVQAIRHLSVWLPHEQFEFDQFLKLRNLVTLHIESEQISIQFVCKLYKQLKLFKYFYFHSERLKFSLMIAYEIAYQDVCLEPDAAGAAHYFSHPYELNYFHHNPDHKEGQEPGPDNRSEIVFRKCCADANELADEINQLKEKQHTKDCLATDRLT